MHARLGDRALFPTLQARSYLHHAAVSPLSVPVQQAVVDTMAQVAAHGVGGILSALEAREGLRAEVAAFLGAQPADIGFPPGTTRGIVDLVLAIDWKAGDRVIVFDGAFPSIVQPFEQAMARVGGEVVRLPLEGFGDGSGRGLERVEAVLAQGGVRTIAVSAVHFASGLRMPLAELSRRAHAHGAELFVDAIQALGVVPFDVDGIDVLVGGSHKWLMGVDGLGIVYAPERVRARLRPRTSGWLSHEEPMGFLGKAGQLRYDRPLRTSMDWVEMGTQTQLPFAALGASLGLIRQLGVPSIHAHVQAFHDAIEAPIEALGFRSLRARDPAARSGSLCFRPPEGVATGALVKGLAARGVVTGTPDGVLRLSPHWPNALDEAPFVVEALAEALRDA